VAPKLRQPGDVPSGFAVNANHFLTRETFLDIVNMCQCRILMVKLYRVKGINIKIVGNRFSSRFSEYIFQYARMHETNSPLFGVLGFKRHLSHFLLHMEMASKSGWKMPPSKRGVPDEVGRVDMDAHQVPPEWHLNDDRIIEILNEMGADVMWWWQNVLHDCDSEGPCDCMPAMDINNPTHVFTEPWKHFNKPDVTFDGVNGEPPVNRGDQHREDEEDGDGVTGALDPGLWCCGLVLWGLMTPNQIQTPSSPPCWDWYRMLTATVIPAINNTSGMDRPDEDRAAGLRP